MYVFMYVCLIIVNYFESKQKTHLNVRVVLTVMFCEVELVLHGFLRLCVKFVRVWARSDSIWIKIRWVVQLIISAFVFVLIVEMRTVFHLANNWQTYVPGKWHDKSRREGSVRHP